MTGLATMLAPACAFGGAVAADERTRAYGRHLAQECASCHRLDGVDNGIPAITGWDAATFLATMAFYRDGARTNPAMVSVARSLDEAQLAALAAHYASLQKSTPAAAKSPK